jgi:NADH-quinone oxidoreductase subunit A
LLADFLPIVMLLGLASLFGLASVWVSSKIGHPKRPNPHKLEPYDCGIALERMPSDPFPVKFYLLAMLFIIFDVEVVFFYPWAAIFREMRVFGLVEMLTFVGFLLVAYVYVWKRGGLDWEEGLPLRNQYVRREERVVRRWMQKVS